MSEFHLFGTGLVRIGAVGATLTDSANGVGSIQSIDSNVKVNKAELRNTPQVNMYVADVGFHGAEASTKLDFNDISRDVYQRVTGATKTTSGGIDTFTIGKTSKPTFFRLEIDMLDNISSRSYSLVYFRCYAVEFPIAAKLDGFANVTMEIFALPDLTTGNVGTCAMQQ